jgi:SpoVK/Ycf46/Vps4 family AAA+-type ATPase
MSKKIGKGLTSLSLKDVSGSAPGQIEGKIRDAFALAETGRKTVFLDECEAVLWDRSLAGTDSMWMISVIDELLTQIAEYPGLVILATNRSEIVDKALADRCFAILQIPNPEYRERCLLWEQKLPPKFPFQPSTLQVEKLASIPINGRRIETAILRCASHAIRTATRPTMSMLYDAAKAMETLSLQV